jgi:hypothetical protein
MSHRRRRSLRIRKTRPKLRSGRGAQGILNGNGRRRLPLSRTVSVRRAYQGRDIRLFERSPHRRGRSRKSSFLRSYDGIRIFDSLAFERTVFASTKNHRPRNRFVKCPLCFRTSFPLKRNRILRIGIRTGNGGILSELRSRRLRMTVPGNGRCQRRVECFVAIGKRNVASFGNSGTVHVRLFLGIFVGRKRLPRGLRNSDFCDTLVSRIRARLNRNRRPFPDRVARRYLGLRNRSGQRNAHGRFRIYLR